MMPTFHYHYNRHSYNLSNKAHNSLNIGMYRTGAEYRLLVMPVHIIHTKTLIFFFTYPGEFKFGNGEFLIGIQQW